MKRPRIILADDHRVFAEGLKALLSDEYEILCIVENGEELLAAVEDHGPDLVVADVSMPKLNGIECVRKLREMRPELKVVLLTMHEEVGLAVAAMRAGAAGYLLKNGGTRDVLLAIAEALEGGVRIAPQVAGQVMEAMRSGRDADRQLTPRQLEIVRLLVEGLSAKEIAARLNLSRRTAEFHKYQAMERVGVTTSAELISYAVKHGIGPV